MDDSPVLAVEGLSVAFGGGGGLLSRLGGAEPAPARAVTDVSFSVARGETFALIGESGAGKSTIARCVAGVLAPSRGRVLVLGREMAGIGRGAEAMTVRRNLQMIFQDPYASLNPRWRAGASIAEPIRAHGTERGRAAVRARVAEMLRLVGLSPEDGARFPHQFSGGQRQRVCIARALSIRPALIVADEPTSALDVSVQAQILNLMRDLQVQFGLTYLFISHDLAVVSAMAHATGVLYLGRIVEKGPTARLLSRPRHPYTLQLVEAVPDIAAPARVAVARVAPASAGEARGPAHSPAGCAFHPRCPMAAARCRAEPPTSRPVDGVEVACHRAEEMRMWDARAG